MPKAFGIWNHDPDWQHHPQQYAQYPYGRFETDWGHASDWGDKLVQKIYANPIVVTPFYKPSREDQRVQAAFDTALIFTKGAQELHDTLKTIEMMAARPSSPDQQQELLQVQQRLRVLTDQMNATSRSLSEALTRSGGNGREQRLR